MELAEDRRAAVDKSMLTPGLCAAGRDMPRRDADCARPRRSGPAVTGGWEPKSGRKAAYMWVDSAMHASLRNRHRKVTQHLFTLCWSNFCVYQLPDIRHSYVNYI